MAAAPVVLDEAARRLATKHRAALTRASKQGADAVVLAVWSFYDEFEKVGFPLPSDWARWERAKTDALKWTAPA